MPETIQFNAVPLTKDQAGNIRGLLAHPGYQLLRDVITSHAIKHQIDASETMIYRDWSEVAKEKTNDAVKRALEYNTALGILDDLEKKEQEWFLAELKPRR